MDTSQRNKEIHTKKEWRNICFQEQTNANKSIHHTGAFQKD